MYVCVYTRMRKRGWEKGWGGREENKKKGRERKLIINAREKEARFSKHKVYPSKVTSTLHKYLTHVI